MEATLKITGKNVRYEDWDRFLSVIEEIKAKYPDLFQRIEVEIEY